MPNVDNINGRRPLTENIFEIPLNRVEKYQSKTRYSG